MALLALLLMGLTANSYRLSAKQQQEHAQLQVARVVNQTLADIIDAYQLNAAANRVAVVRQLESERTLRYETEDRLKRFTATAANDNCAVSRMPESGINSAQCGLTYCSDPLRSWGNKQLECRLAVLNPSHSILKFGYTLAT